MKACVEIDNETQQINQQLTVELSNLKFEITKLKAQKDEILNSISDLEKNANEVGQKMLKQNIELANNSFEHQAETLANKFQKESNLIQQEYLQTLEELSVEMSAEIEKRKNMLSQLDENIKEKQSLINAIVAANKRTLEIEEKQNFYRLILSEQDIQEINRLKAVLPYLRDKESLNKVLWKVYYEKPYTDLIGRVVGDKTRTGIYKITNIKNNMCYVGQSVNIADRWKQHIKRGVGAETPTRNKLYPVMLAIGVENFTFEIIEDCSRDKLDEREDYWQNYFHAKDYGYSIK